MDIWQRIDALLKGGHVVVIKSRPGDRLLVIGFAGWHGGYVLNLNSIIAGHSYGLSCAINVPLVLGHPVHSKYHIQSLGTQNNQIRLELLTVEFYWNVSAGQLGLD
jgi:hypothetical protein